ncbi:hypothetical protein ACQEU8_02335 [Streptomyces sp. CA-250714]|uniref:hypothetical protein n=1 Tax=Streptomyces sp. CA-250714 TaxID=3240060 RepID=UPI003D92A4BE
MFDVTLEQIQAAQANDLGAISEIIAATEDRITYLARQAASTNGHLDHALAEDYAQDGRMAMWQAIGSYSGEAAVGQFIAYLDRSLKAEILTRRRDFKNEGVHHMTAWRFACAVREAGGQLDEAERIAGKFQLSPEAARAARMAYGGPVRFEESKGEVPTEDEQREADKERSRRTGQRVRGTLAMLGEQQRIVLSALTGVGDIREYGAEHDDELSEDHGIPRQRVKVIRSKGKKRFAELYEMAYGPMGE